MTDLVSVNQLDNYSVSLMATSKAPKMALGKVGQMGHKMALPWVQLLGAEKVALREGWLAKGKDTQKDEKMEYPSENPNTYLGFLVQGMYHQWRIHNCCQNK